jgi:hypothetical protein
MASVLALYTAIASLGKTHADSVKDHFDFGMKPLEKCLFSAKKLPQGDHDLRQVYIDFILALLENGGFETKEVVSKMRAVFASIFKQLARDHPMMQRRVLLTLKRTIIDEQSGYAMAVSVFSAINIHAIVLLNEGDKDNAGGEWTDYLHALLTCPGHGVCFKVEPGLQLKNRIALDLLPMLKPLESERQQNLAVAILTSCPDCTLPYLEKMRFNFGEPGGAGESTSTEAVSERWTALMAFMSRILQIKVPADLACLVESQMSLSWCTW